MDSAPMTNDDLNQIRNQISDLGNRMADQFDRIRTEMQLSMQAYTLNAVYQKDMQRLDEKDKAQQDAIDVIQKQFESMFTRALTRIGSITGVLIAIYTLLHVTHIIP